MKVPVKEIESQSKSPIWVIWVHIAYYVWYVMVTWSKVKTTHVLNLRFQSSNTRFCIRDTLYLNFYLLKKYFSKSL